MSPAGSNVEPVRLLLLQAKRTVNQISKGGGWGTLAVSPLVTAAWVRLQKSLGFLLSTLQNVNVVHCAQFVHKRPSLEDAVSVLGTDPKKYLVTRSGDLRKCGGGGRTGPYSQPHHSAHALWFARHDDNK